MAGDRALSWRKSSYSGNNGGQCIEVATPGHEVAIRDSKNPSGMRLVFSTQTWREFTSSLKTSSDCV